MTHYQKARKIYNIIKNEEQPSLILQAAQEIYNGNFKAKKMFKDAPDDIDRIALKLEKMEGKKK